MLKLVLMTTIALTTMAAAPAASVQPAMAATQTAAVAPPQGGDAPATAQAPAAEEKKICKTLPSSGTRFTKKACLTVKEWKQVEADVEGADGI